MEKWISRVLSSEQPPLEADPNKLWFVTFSIFKIDWIENVECFEPGRYSDVGDFRRGTYHHQVGHTGTWDVLSRNVSSFRTFCSVMFCDLIFRAVGYYVAASVIVFSFEMVLLFFMPKEKKKALSRTINKYVWTRQMVIALSSLVCLVWIKRIQMVCKAYLPNLTCKSIILAWVYCTF
jgi:hypothetical protein